MKLNKIMTDTKSIRYPSTKDINGVDKAIDNAIISAKTMKDKVQIAGVMIGAWLGKHGDKPTACSQATRLVHGMGTGIKSEALIGWFVDCMGFQVGEVEVKSGDMKGETVDGFVNVDINKLKANWNCDKMSPKKRHWVTFAKPTDWKGFVFEDKLQALLKGADDAIGKVEQARLEGDDISSKVDIDETRLQALKMLMDLSNDNLAALIQQAGQMQTDPGEVNFDAGLGEDEAPTDDLASA